MRISDWSSDVCSSDLLRSGTGQFPLQAGEYVETPDRHVDDRLDALLLQAIDDIGGNTGIDGGLGHRRIGLVDEHRHRAGAPAGNLETRLEDVAAGIFSMDGDAIRRAELGRAAR